jgi:hypothetical protein
MDAPMSDSQPAVLQVIAAVAILSNRSGLGAVMARESQGIGRPSPDLKSGGIEEHL